MSSPNAVECLSRANCKSKCNEYLEGCSSHAKNSSKAGRTRAIIPTCIENIGDGRTAARLLVEVRMATRF